MQQHLPRAVVYAALKYQGLAFPNLYVETGIQHISLVLQETYHNSLMGKLLRMSIEAAKVEVGVGGPLLMQPFE
jgi:lambda repressor-like predicted transcriptional regulator